MKNARLSTCLVAALVGGEAARGLTVPTGAEGFTRMFAEKNDQTWSGGDQTTSFKAPNGRIYWISADTILSNGVDPDGSYPDSGTTMINGRIMLQNGDQLENAMASGGVAIPLPAQRLGNQEKHWPQGAFVAGGYLYVLAQRIGSDPTPGSLGFKFHGTELAKYRFEADGKLAFVAMVPTPSTGIPAGNGAAHLQWAADAIEYRDHIYVYGYTHAEPGDPSGHYSYVARVAKHRVEEPAAWRFYSKSRQAWVRSMKELSTARNNPDAILATQITSSRVIGGKIVIAHKPWNGFGSSVFAELGNKPEGPFRRVKLFESPAGTWKGRNYVTYGPMLHPEQPLTGKDAGKLLVSINWNGKDFWADVVPNADLYKPRFYAVTVPKAAIRPCKSARRYRQAGLRCESPDKSRLGGPYRIIAHHE